MVSRVFGIWNQLRATNTFRCRASLLFGTKSKRLNVFSLFPIAWIGLNSGVSRKRPDLRPFAAMNHPNFGPPTPALTASDGVPNDPYWARISPLGLISPRPERVVALTTRL